MAIEEASVEKTTDMAVIKGEDTRLHLLKIKLSLSHPKNTMARQTYDLTIDLCEKVTHT